MLSFERGESALLDAAYAGDPGGSRGDKKSAGAGVTISKPSYIESTLVALSSGLDLWGRGDATSPLAVVFGVRGAKPREEVDDKGVFGAGKARAEVFREGVAEAVPHLKREFGSARRHRQISIERLTVLVLQTLESGLGHLPRH